jgi:hypothetical protein
MLIGASIPVVITGVVDTVTWGIPFFPVWKSLHVQLLERETRRLGAASGPMFYLQKILWEWGAAAIFIAVPFVAGVRRSLPLVVTVAAVAMTHTLVAYKEINYIYAATELILIVAALGTAELVVQASQRPHARLNRQAGGLAAAILWSGAAVGTAASAGFVSYWAGNPAPLAAASLLRKSRDMCGLGLFRIAWQGTAGYAWMDRDVPTYALDNLDQLRTASPAFNYVIADAAATTDVSPRFAVVKCWNGWCVMRRDGDCSKVPGLQDGLQHGRVRP